MQSQRGGCPWDIRRESPRVCPKRDEAIELPVTRGMQAQHRRCRETSSWKSLSLVALPTASLGLHILGPWD